MVRTPACGLKRVSFRLRPRSSSQPDRTILHRISFEIPAGKTVAVVGPSRVQANRRWRACSSASTM